MYETPCVGWVERREDRRPELWRKLGDLAVHVDLAWIGEIAGPNPALAEVLARKVAAMKEELGGPAPSLLERLLVDRIAACWLQLHHADLAVARPVDETVEGRERLRKRQEAAERRHAGAIEALARVRRLPPAGGIPSPGSGEQPAEPGMADCEAVDVVPFEPASGGPGSTDRAIPTGGSRPQRRARRI
ncbi:MAG TPA: hypothetical protein VF590_23110 [Isosphaeraceae bacterium]